MNDSESNEISDRIERQVMLKAPRARVWKALSEAEEFGSWFGVDLKGVRFETGRQAQGQITHKGYEHVTWKVTLESIEPQRRLSWRWHPHGIDPAHDYSKEPTTLVVFELEDAPGGGTLLKVTESGFDRIPLARRNTAYRGNSGGWTQQMEFVKRHLDG